MLKTSLIPFVLIILVCISCDFTTNSKSQLDGLWIKSYAQFSQNGSFINSRIDNYKFFLKFNGNEVRIVKFDGKETGEPIDTIINFKQKDNKIILENDLGSLVEIEIAKDSLIMTSYYNQIHRSILKKLPENSKRVHWNPSKKQYKVFYDEGKEYFDFRNDSILHSFSDGIGRLIKNHWKIEHIDNHTILVFGYDFELYDNGTLLIDSLVGNKVYATDYTYGKRQFVLEEQKIVHKKPTTLLGTWKLIAKENSEADTLRLPYPISLNYLEKINFYKDSLLVFQPPFRHVDEWKYYENNKTIVLNKRGNVIKVVKLTKDSLVLNMDLTEHYLMNKKFTFIRE